MSSGSGIGNNTVQNEGEVRIEKPSPAQVPAPALIDALRPERSFLVVFKVKCTCVPARKEVRLVGDLPCLGGWNLQDGLSMAATNFPEWSVTVNLADCVRYNIDPFAPSFSFQYKYVIAPVAGTGATDARNPSASASSSGRSSGSGTPDSVVGSTAGTPEIASPSTLPLAPAFFQAPALSAGPTPAVPVTASTTPSVGGSSVSGSGNSVGGSGGGGGASSGSSATAQKPADFFWEVCANRTFRFIDCDSVASAGGSARACECSAAALVVINKFGAGTGAAAPETGTIFVVVEDFPFDMGPWRGAGVSADLAAVRTSCDMGVGEFSDIPLLTDFAVRAGLTMIQLTPVNDTTLPPLTRPLDLSSSSSSASSSSQVTVPSLPQQGGGDDEEENEGEDGREEKEKEGGNSEQELRTEQRQVHRQQDEEEEGNRKFSRDPLCANPDAPLSVFALHPAHMRISGLTSDPVIVSKAQSVQQRLNQRDTIDLAEVLVAKFELLAMIYRQQREALANDPQYAAFCARNQEWLEPYAQAKQHEFARVYGPEYEPGLFVFAQWVLHAQLARASAYAAQRRVTLCVEVPAFVHPECVEARKDPHLFYRRLSVGDPPSGDSPISGSGGSGGAASGTSSTTEGTSATESVDSVYTMDEGAMGVNRRLPVPNWRAQEGQGYRFWCERFAHLAQYFQGVCLREVSAYFRVWAVPARARTGRPGHFVPQLAPACADLERRGLGDCRAYSAPFITDRVVMQAFGPDAADRAVRELLVPVDGTARYAIRPELCAALDADPAALPDWARRPLARLRENTLLTIVDERPRGGSGGVGGVPIGGGLSTASNSGANGGESGNGNSSNGNNGNNNGNGGNNNNSGSLYAVPVPHMEDISLGAMDSMDRQTRQLLLAVHDEYYLGAANSRLWKSSGVALLQSLASTTSLFLSGEDAPELPQWAAEGMRDAGVPLQCPIWACSTPLGDIPHWSLAASSSLSRALLRCWWEENRSTPRARQFYADVLGMSGELPHFCETYLVQRAVLKCLQSQAVFALLPLPDLLALRAEFIAGKDPHQEELGPWVYRMQMSLESLVANTSFTQLLRGLIRNNGRSPPV